MLVRIERPMLVCPLQGDLSEACYGQAKCTALTRHASKCGYTVGQSVAGAPILASMPPTNFQQMKHSMNTWSELISRFLSEGMHCNQGPPAF